MKNKITFPALNFAILKAKNDELSVEELEGVILSVIEYFKEQAI
jgi:hypothetical protein